MQHTLLLSSSHDILHKAFQIAYVQGMYIDMKKS